VLSVAVALPLSGWTGDRFGNGRVVRVALVVLALVVLALVVLVLALPSASCACAPTLLVRACVGQGFGGAGLVPVGRLVVLRSTTSADLVRAPAH